MQRLFGWSTPPVLLTSLVLNTLRGILTCSSQLEIAVDGDRIIRIDQAAAAVTIIDVQKYVFSAGFEI